MASSASELLDHVCTRPHGISTSSMLTIKRPTSTTVLYTVSTSPAIKTVTVRLQIIILTLLRLLLGTQVLLILWQEAQTHSRTVAGYDSPFSDTAPGRLAILVTEKLRWQFVLPICAAVAWVITRRGYTEESLLVIRGLGVQTSTSSPSYLSAASTRFIPTNMIQDIFIYEAFKGFEVKFYLAIVVEREQDVVVVFPNILPKRQLLEEVWRGARACLYEPNT